MPCPIRSECSRGTLTPTFCPEGWPKCVDVGKGCGKKFTLHLPRDSEVCRPPKEVPAVVHSALHRPVKATRMPPTAEHFAWISVCAPVRAPGLAVHNSPQHTGLELASGPDARKWLASRSTASRDCGAERQGLHLASTFSSSSCIFSRRPPSFLRAFSALASDACSSNQYVAHKVGCAWWLLAITRHDREATSR